LRCLSVIFPDFSCENTFRYLSLKKRIFSGRKVESVGKMLGMVTGAGRGRRILSGGLKFVKEHKNRITKLHIYISTECKNFTTKNKYPTAIISVDLRGGGENG